MDLKMQTRLRNAIMTELDLSYRAYSLVVECEQREVTLRLFDRRSDMDDAQMTCVARVVISPWDDARFVEHAEVAVGMMRGAIAGYEDALRKK